MLVTGKRSNAYIKKVKKVYVALRGKLSQSYAASLAIWDHTVIHRGYMYTIKHFTSSYVHGKSTGLKHF